MKRPYDAVAPPAALPHRARRAASRLRRLRAGERANPCFEFLRSGSCRNGDRCKYVHGPAPEDGRLPKDGRCHAHFYLGGCPRRACRYSRGGDHVGAFAIQAESVRETLEAGKRDRARPPPPPPARRRSTAARDAATLSAVDGVVAELRPLLDAREYTLVFAALGRVRADGRVRPLLDEARRAGRADVICYNAAISAAGSWRRARPRRPRALVGDPAAEPDAISYNAAIAACERAGDCDGALRLFASLKRRGLRPTAVSYNAVVAACARGGRWAAALECLGRMPGDGVPPDSVVYHAVVGACEAAGEGDAATAAYAAALDGGALAARALGRRRRVPPAARPGAGRRGRGRAARAPRRRRRAGDAALLLARGHGGGAGPGDGRDRDAAGDDR
ncbi:endonuclease [Aureococcus anophagefferens]|nr:endonuclease [Aureococcus anophagefferens]